MWYTTPASAIIYCLLGGCGRTLALLCSLMTVIISNATLAAAGIGSRTTTGISCIVPCQRLLRTMISIPSIGDLGIVAIAAFARWFLAAATFRTSMERSSMILRRAMHAWLAVVRRSRSLGGLLSSSRILDSACPAICADLFRSRWTGINMRWSSWTLQLTLHFCTC